MADDEDASKEANLADWIDVPGVTKSIINPALEKLINTAGKHTKKYWARYKNKKKETYSNYLSKRGKTASSVRNLIYEHESAHISEIYIPTHLASVNFYLDDERFIQDLNVERLIKDGDKGRLTPALVVQGNAGSGKSMLMRSTFLHLAQILDRRIPILLELKDFNSINLGPIESMIVSVMVDYDARITHDQIQDGLEIGLFVILFDGFDELKTSIRPHVEKEILRAAKTYDACPIVVSSRAMEAQKSWELFSTLYIQPLEKPAVIELLKKLSFDDQVKGDFIAEVNNKLYASHKDFLGIPLLVIVMLLTFQDVGRISINESEFFEDAFNALWNKHDARKGYVRTRHTDLNKSQFSKLLSAFAAASYVHDQISMKEDDFEDCLVEARDLASIDVGAYNFLEDLLESTNLFIRDGNKIRFSHRLFHEYFAARFVVYVDDEKARKLIDIFAKRAETDYVLHFIYSLDEDKLERCWVLPRLRELTAELEKIGTSVKKYRQFFNTNRDFLVATRSVYKFNPKSVDVAAAIDTAESEGLTELRFRSGFSVETAFEDDDTYSEFDGDVLEEIDRLGDSFLANTEDDQHVFGRQGTNVIFEASSSDDLAGDAIIEDIQNFELLMSKLANKHEKKAGRLGAILNS